MQTYYVFYLVHCCNQRFWTQKRKSKTEL